MVVRSLNLDSMFQPTAFPEIEFKMIQFSGGEQHIKLNNLIDYSRIDKVVISTRLRNGDDIMKLMIAVDALKYLDIKHFDLIMPYIPYARQDRYEISGESFTLKVFTNLINSIGFDKVYVFDAHSDVSTGLINNCVNIPNTDYVAQAIIDITTATKRELNLVSPDSGVNKKINKLFDKVKHLTKDVIKCDKVRNMNTGELSDFTVFSDDLKGMDCLIVDDICDGGRTFIGVAKALREKNCGNVYLFVSHGIFSYGTHVLLDYINIIYTTNSFSDVNADSLTTPNYVKQFKFEL